MILAKHCLHSCFANKSVTDSKFTCFSILLCAYLPTECNSTVLFTNAERLLSVDRWSAIISL